MALAGFHLSQRSLDPSVLVGVGFCWIIVHAISTKYAFHGGCSNMIRCGGEICEIDNQISGMFALLMLAFAFLPSKPTALERVRKIPEKELRDEMLVFFDVGRHCDGLKAK